jgi:hypothetical protein
MQSSERANQQIFVIRGYKVIFSLHLAELYGVETRALIQALKRNHTRFSEDFMFQLKPEEVEFLRSQNAILEKSGRGTFSKYMPYAFTQEGVAVLSSVLGSPRVMSYISPLYKKLPV